MEVYDYDADREHSPRRSSLTTGSTNARPERTPLLPRRLYEARDFYLACYLRCVGRQLAGVRREGTHCVFILVDHDTRPDAVIAYYQHKAEVPALSLVAIIKEMKALLHNT